MNEPIVNKIKLLKGIKPEGRYKDNLKNVLLSNLQQPIERPRFSLRESLASGFTMLLASAFVLLLFVGGNYLQKLATPLFLPGLHQEGLISELDDLDIQIKIAEAKYYNEAPSAVSTILNETGNNTTNHLNGKLIQKEDNFLEIKDPTNPKIDDVLNQLL